MRSVLRQIWAMTRSSLLSLPRRMAISLSMVIAIMLVVCVLSGFLAMARGFEVTLDSAGSPRVAVILGGGTRHESQSDVPADTTRALLAMRGDIGVVRDATGAVLLSREQVVPVIYRDASDAIGQTLALRGMDPTGPNIRVGVTLSAGRFAAHGRREIAVGDQLAASFPAFKIGNQIRLGPVVWTVVGHFSAQGSAFESEIWGDLDVVGGVFDRVGEVHSLRFRLRDPAAIGRLQAAVDPLTGGPFTVLSEADLYAGQSAHTGRMIRLFGWPIALLMALGATAGALNTMMSSLSERTVEIATVRALGFSRTAAFFATWVEAVLLSALGVGLGLGVSWVALNGWQASTLGAHDTRMAFRLVVDAGGMATAGLLGLSIGALGGAFPALAAARMEIVAGLRAH